MAKNIFPQFLQEAIFLNFAAVCATATMLDIEDVARDLTDKDDTSPIKDWLSSSELAKLNSFKMQKRKNEWLTGRLCAKIAADDFIALQNRKARDKNQIIIQNAPSGRPYITLPQAHQLKDGWDLSISHSGRYAVAVTADADCGIDIQERRQTLFRVKERFCLDREETLLQSQISGEDELAPLTLLWAAKESIRKAYSKHFIPEFLQIQLNTIKASKDGWWVMTFSHTDIAPTIIGGFFKEYGIAICISQGVSHAGIT